MADFLLELYSEEVPPKLQINARKQISDSFISLFNKEDISFKKLDFFSSPKRIIISIKNLPFFTKDLAKEIKGPRINVPEEIVKAFLNSHGASDNDLVKKTIDKGEFYFLKIKEKKRDVKEILEINIPKILKGISWKKSMKWSDNEIFWGRPLHSILALFNNKIITFKYGHIESISHTFVEQNYEEVPKKINSFKDYESLMRKNSIIFDHENRKKLILNKFKSKIKQKFIENFDEVLLEEVTNIVENPNVILASFDKKYLRIPKEIIISTLKVNQRYFPLFDPKNNLTNNFFIVSNKPDVKNIIKTGNQRVVESRLADANFFWERDKSKNLIKQINKLKSITFFEKIGTVFDKTQRLRKLSSFMSDELNFNKEKAEIAASISKTDLCSDLVGEYPDLQGIMGKHFAISQGFDEDIAQSVSDHYLPTGNDSKIPRKTLSCIISIADKIDSLVSFFAINFKPTSSKDPFALRRAAIGLLKIVIENKLSLRVKDLINYNLRLLEEHGVKIENNSVEKEILDFLKDRMRNILKEKKIQKDIIEASLSTHIGDNYYDLYRKNLLMQKHIKKEIGKNAISSYKRAYNIIENKGQGIQGRPDAVLFRKEEEKILYERIHKIRKDLIAKNNNKDYELLLKSLSETKILTDIFFDKVVVNDENNDIKNNRLELLKMFCNTFDNFINFSKLEGI